ncbi:MAG: hypothetical protein RQ966_15355 [Acetobacteraceae bacterium]|nr:hypothetical protein [Acetobacteraceae bacterium]
MTAAPPACGICGTRCRPPFRAPAAELAPDLDGRPGEPARSPLGRWVALCPGCGAAAPDLAALPASAAPIVRRDDYAAEPDRFLRWSILAAATGDPAAAAEAILQAAWRQEDEGHDATALRRRAAAIWTGDPLRRIDILRRAGALAEAEAEAASLTGLDEDQRRILDFQRARIAAGDTARYAISSALRPPARTPHVTHGQRAPARTGLLSRLFGR